MLRANRHTSSNTGVYEQIKIEELTVYTPSRGFLQKHTLSELYHKLFIHNNEAFYYASHM